MSVRTRWLAATSVSLARSPGAQSAARQRRNERFTALGSSRRVRRARRVARERSRAESVGAVWATRPLAAFLYGVSPTDPLTFVSVPVLFLLVALLATVVPARRATRVDPMKAESRLAVIAEEPRPECQRQPVSGPSRPGRRDALKLEVDERAVAEWAEQE